MTEQKLTLERFKQNYWYKTDLKKLCIQLGLLSYGTKAELESRIQLYLTTGEKVVKETQASQNSCRLKNTGRHPISLEMSLILGGFRFSQLARDFFSEYFGVKRFTFTKEMCAALREAEKRKDLSMTVRRLIKQTFLKQIQPL